MSNKVWAKVIVGFCTLMSVVLFTLIYKACEVTMVKTENSPPIVDKFEGELYDWWELSPDDDLTLIIKE